MATRASRLTGLGFLIALVVAIADQASKSAVLYGADFIHCNPCRPIEVTPFFDIVMLWNRGISYGLLPDGSELQRWLLVGFSLTMSVILSWWLTRATSRWLAVGLGLVIGGALGNVIDRFLYGAVADFFHFHAFGKSWYVFNVADAAIVFGVVAILIDAVFVGRSSRSAALEGASDDAR